MERLGQIASKEMTRTPNDPDLHSEIGKFYLTYGKPEVGLRWLYRALKLDPGHRASHRLLHDYYKQHGDPERAEQHRTKAAPSAHAAPWGLLGDGACSS
jgi:uncharacterized protein HemY